MMSVILRNQILYSNLIFDSDDHAGFSVVVVSAGDCPESLIFIFYYPVLI